MKKKIFVIILVIISLFNIFIISSNLVAKQKEKLMIKKLSNNLSIDEINYVLNNNVDIENLNLYLKYSKFDVYKYFYYEKLRNENNYSHLESINAYNNPNYYNFYNNPKPAVFTDTPLVLVNKCFYLEKNYVPSNLINVTMYHIDYTNPNIMLKKIVLDQLQTMYNDALKQGINFTIFSGYRSYQRQEYLYYEVYNDDSISARPGFSEHQTGYAVDISTRDVGLTDKFKSTTVFNWLINHAPNYGFILRFPEGKSNTTSYIFEPWHFRYVGDIAPYIMENKITLEEYLFMNVEI